MKMKFFLVLVLLMLEIVYAGRMVLHSDDAGVVKTVMSIPVFSELFYEYRIEETRAKAEAGDVHQMMVLYYTADSMKQDDDKALAIELLEQSGTATSELFLHIERGEQIENDPSREFLLLTARAMKENIRPYVPKGDANFVYVHQSRQYARAFEILQAKARQGDPDAIWVLDSIGLPAEG